MKIFLKLIPLTLLICFICFGLTIIFDIQNLTYLSRTTKDNITIYTFDMNQYVQNLNIDILKRATTNTIDVETFKNVFESWGTIWDNGYDFGDIFFSLLNGFIMVFDLLIVPINLVLIVLRIIAGIMLTGLSLIGININSNGVILTTLNNILDFSKIPLISPALP